MPPRNLVNLHSVAKGYGSRSVLHDVTLGINEGERVGIVGDNGAGKSTLMRLLAGAEPPDQGTATHTTGAERGAGEPAGGPGPREHGARRAGGRPARS